MGGEKRRGDPWAASVSQRGDSGGTAHCKGGGRARPTAREGDVRPRACVAGACDQAAPPGPHGPPSQNECLSVLLPGVGRAWRAVSLRRTALATMPPYRTGRAGAGEPGLNQRRGRRAGAGVVGGAAVWMGRGVGATEGGGFKQRAVGVLSMDRRVVGSLIQMRVVRRMGRAAGEEGCEYG